MMIAKSMLKLWSVFKKQLLVVRIMCTCLHQWEYQCQKQVKCAKTGKWYFLNPEMLLPMPKSMTPLENMTSKPTGSISSDQMPPNSKYKRWNPCCKNPYDNNPYTYRIYSLKKYFWKKTLKKIPSIFVGRDFSTGICSPGFFAGISDSQTEYLRKYSYK